ncbi:alpha/beta hydrolase [Mycolicibacterium agri]|uniref:Alpha/beta hydrolase n=1 Tax=Mycolicibacterium agri TaxID=36811 RepID=A0A2A7NA08_MYCAG|nr:alpha/beta hydrolase [Mycolicibacterium agri]PEG40942.1 alpha/beta hydrolase [Mycolicibacterium agri]GFG52202.1 hypothetical protein MAGR_36430 [Mycolicibacterium agri]
MGDRFFLWLGAGAITAGVTVGMLAGAGVAYAQTDGSDSGTKTSQSSDSTNSTEKQQDSSPSDTKQKSRRDTTQTAEKGDTRATGRDRSDENDGKSVAEKPRKALKNRTRSRHSNAVDNVVAAVTQRPHRTVVVGKSRSIAKAETVETKTEPVQTEPVETEPVEPQPVATRAVVTKRVAATNDAAQPTRLANVTPMRATTSDVTIETPLAAQARPTAAASAPVRVPPVVSAIGTLVFGLIALAESVFEGPPMVPPALRDDVTVRRSTLTIREGHDVPADWYFPTGDTPPEGVIYLQHGFLARGVFYDYTAANLATQTNSIVVAPSLTSNIFATDGMWLGGDQMHRAVADLFTDENTALLASAQAAGYEGDALPTKVVLVGHSLGGGLVIDTARYMQRNGSADRLAGVLMLDGVSFTDPRPILEDLDGIPVYNLSATPYFWNLFGSMDHALAGLDDGDFHGVQLRGGLHSDAMIGGNPLVAFGAYLLTGFSQPANVEASQILAATWINDMFTGTRTDGFYGEPGENLPIPTRFGTAVGLVAPQPGIGASVARQLTAVFLAWLAGIDFATDVPDAVNDAPEARETGVLQEKSPCNTLQSLDGKRRTGQSVGQHVVCTG